jgi:hypothetical protein
MVKLVFGLISSIPAQVSISAVQPIHLIHALGRRSRPLQCGTRRTISRLLPVVHVSAGRRHVGPSCHYCLLPWPLDPVDATDRMPSRLGLHRLGSSRLSWPCFGTPVRAWARAPKPSQTYVGFVTKRSR